MSLLAKKINIDSENYHYSYSLIKFIQYKELLTNIKNDTGDTLSKTIEILEFWSKFSFEDAPETILNLEKMDRSKVFSPEHLEKIISESGIWLSEQERLLY